MSGTDFGIRYIIADVDGKELTISFRESFRRGIHAVSFHSNGTETPYKIKSTYPGALRRLRERVLLIQITLRRFYNRL